MKKEIYLAGGCFWGLEKYLENINGVIYSEVGYANGITENPSSFKRVGKLKEGKNKLYEEAVSLGLYKHNGIVLIQPEQPVENGFNNIME